MGGCGFSGSVHDDEDSCRKASGDLQGGGRRRRASRAAAACACCSALHGAHGHDARGSRRKRADVPLCRLPPAPARVIVDGILLYLGPQSPADPNPSPIASRRLDHCIRQRQRRPWTRGITQVGKQWLVDSSTPTCPKRCRSDDEGYPDLISMALWEAPMAAASAPSVVSP
jgi:hypothetical protein